MQITQPSQFRCSQLQYRFAVISEAPSIQLIFVTPPSISPTQKSSPLIHIGFTRNSDYSYNFSLLLSLPLFGLKYFVTLLIISIYINTFSLFHRYMPLSVYIYKFFFFLTQLHCVSLSLVSLFLLLSQTLNNCYSFLLYGFFPQICVMH